MKHFKKVCKVCNEVIAQCRCMDCNKTTEYGICAMCNLEKKLSDFAPQGCSSSGNTPDTPSEREED